LALFEAFEGVEVTGTGPAMGAGNHVWIPS
jgi:hypothetical protein